MPIFPSRGSIRLAELRQPCSTRIEALVLAGGRRQLLWFETDGPPVQESADAFLPVLLPAAMAAGLRLHIEAPVSPEVVAGAHRVSDLLASWYPHWRELNLTVASLTHPPQPAESTPQQAAFFSGGVDSFRTLQRCGDQLRHLLFVHGFDIAPAEQEKAQFVRRALTQVAAEAGPSLLTVRTNLRSFTNRWVDWEQHQHGCALAAVALLLAPHVGKVWIPSSFSLPFLHPHGSHPALETLWSTSALELLHDTFSEDRIDKVRELACWRLARCQLRVCWQPHTPELNCGRCHKCLWTQALLRGFCGDQDWPTFPAHLDLEALALLKLKRLWMVHSRNDDGEFFTLRSHLRQSGQDPDLLAAVNLLLLRHEQRGWVVALRQLVVLARALLRP